jgi:hypothetical protein
MNQRLRLGEVAITTNSEVPSIQPKVLVPPPSSRTGNVRDPGAGTHHGLALALTLHGPGFWPIPGQNDDLKCTAERFRKKTTRQLRMLQTRVSISLHPIERIKIL